MNTDSAILLNATFARIPLLAGGLGLVSQSGALGIAVLNAAARSGLGVSEFVSVGNKADLSSNDLLLAWENDRRTRVIALYLESFGNPAKFARIANRVSRSKPIIAIKAARSPPVNTPAFHTPQPPRPPTTSSTRSFGRQACCE